MASKPRGPREELHATQRAGGEGRSLAETMPRLILEARRIAATVIHGLHGRKRAGPGENFWQYRRFVVRRAGAARRLAPLGARRASLRARAGMGSRAHRLDLGGPLAVDALQVGRWPRNPSSTARWCVAFALAEVLVQAGERVGMPGLMRPTGSRNVLDKMANAILHDPRRARACRSPSRRRRSPRSW